MRKLANDIIKAQDALKEMYNEKDYKKLIKTAKKKIGELSLATDMNEFETVGYFMKQDDISADTKLAILASLGE